MTVLRSFSGLMGVREVNKAETLTVLICISEAIELQFYSLLWKVSFHVQLDGDNHVCWAAHSIQISESIFNELKDVTESYCISFHHTPVSTVMLMLYLKVFHV